MQLRTLLVWLIKKEQQKWEEEQITAWPNPKYKEVKRELCIYSNQIAIYFSCWSRRHTVRFYQTLSRKKHYSFDYRPPCFPFFLSIICYVNEHLKREMYLIKQSIKFVTPNYQKSVVRVQFIKPHESRHGNYITN